MGFRKQHKINKREVQRKILLTPFAPPAHTWPSLSAARAQAIGFKSVLNVVYPLSKGSASVKTRESPSRFKSLKVERLKGLKV